MHVLVVHIY